MKNIYRMALVLLIAAPLFAGNDHSKPGQQCLSRGDTLKYDSDTFDNGLGFYTGTGVVWPDSDSTFGFADHFILHEWGLSNQKITGIMLFFNTINDATYNFRLYVWRNTGPGLYPGSQGVQLYRNLGEIMPEQGLWGYFDLSSQNILLPDTFWIGICYNHFATNTNEIDWFLGMNTTEVDDHMYLNDMDDAVGWIPAGDWAYGYPYGVRAVVANYGDVSESRVLIPGTRRLLSAPSICRNRANIEYVVTAEASIDLAVLDAAGRVSQTLVNGRVPAGTYRKTFDLNLSSGVYFLRYETSEGDRATQKFTVVD